ncbi:hypothetical protein DPMN_131245 [Dreissena polymorpha]|uniref:Uncharacterized protein n=1 Tax=Dreissena polymorpha TaxID=45954 RepID=A0A9D4JZ62_DREPO|nr:hypothetical protein DPMN_131245 [Dreissena polymorpha]
MLHVTVQVSGLLHFSLDIQLSAKEILQIKDCSVNMFLKRITWLKVFRVKPEFLFLDCPLCPPPELCSAPTRGP